MQTPTGPDDTDPDSAGPDGPGGSGPRGSDSGGSVPAAAYPAVCAHTHLFPGARCRVRGLADPEAFASAPYPIDVVLRFSDDVVAEAELRLSEPAHPTLAVPAYTTAAGTTVKARTWTVRESVRAGDEVEWKIGGHART